MSREDDYHKSSSRNNNQNSISGDGFSRGFGGNGLSIANIQLPYIVVSLVVSIASGFIVSKFGNQRPTISGILISIVGFLSMFVFHSTEILITINLAIIATGISLTQIGSINIILVNTPKQSDNEHNWYGYLDDI